MLGERINTGGDRQKIRLRKLAKRQNRVHRRSANRERTGFVEGDGCDLRQRFERLAAFAKAAADRGIEIVPITALVQTGRT